MEKIAVRITEDYVKMHSQRNARLQEKCGSHLDRKPQIGMVWSVFISCQTRQFRLLGQESMASVVVSVYLNDDKALRLHVTNDGRIVRWYVPKR